MEGGRRVMLLVSTKGVLQEQMGFTAHSFHEETKHHLWIDQVIIAILPLRVILFSV